MWTRWTWAGRPRAPPRAGSGHAPRGGQWRALRDQRRVGGAARLVVAGPAGALAATLRHLSGTGQPARGTTGWPEVAPFFTLLRFRRHDLMMQPHIQPPRARAPTGSPRQKPGHRPPRPPKPITRPVAPASGPPRTGHPQPGRRARPPTPPPLLRLPRSGAAPDRVSPHGTDARPACRPPASPPPLPTPPGVGRPPAPGRSPDLMRLNHLLTLGFLGLTLAACGGDEGDAESAMIASLEGRAGSRLAGWPGGAADVTLLRFAVIAF